MAERLTQRLGSDYKDFVVSGGDSPLEAMVEDLYWFLGSQDPWTFEYLTVKYAVKGWPYDRGTLELVMGKQVTEEQAVLAPQLRDEMVKAVEAMAPEGTVFSKDNFEGEWGFFAPEVGEDPEAL